MSKRAEERALEAYPDEMVTTLARGNKFRAGPIYRKGFVQGYEQAEKDTIDKACKWLEENVVIYPHADNKPICIVNLDTFKKAMEEEQ